MAASLQLSLEERTPGRAKAREDVRRLRASLEARVAAKLTSATELLRALENRRREELLPTTLDAFDKLLGGGLPRGKVVELAGSRRAAGRFSIVVAALAAATSAGEAAVLIDLGDHLDPRVAEAIGVDLRRLLWIRPQTMKEAVMAAEMIAATGFPFVALDAGLAPLRGRVPDATWVRLSRSAEAHGTALLVSTPYPLTGTTSEAVVSAHSAQMKWTGRGKSPRLLAGIELKLTLQKHRHMRPGKTETLMLKTLESCLD